MDLVKIDQALPQQYQNMLSEVSEYYPVIAKATRNFNKTQSQYMNNMMTVSQPTELRSLRQILAEITKSKQALDETFYKIRKQEIEVKVKQRQLGTEKDELVCEMLQVEVAELESKNRNTMGYVEGAIRRVSAFMVQYRTLLKTCGKEEVTEEDFEKDEERYHIMKMFEQALCAARSRGGSIDEGNHIYAYQIGISGTAAQVEVSTLLETEGKMIVAGKMPTHEMTWKWMHEMADKYAGSAKKFCELKGMELIQQESLHDPCFD